MFKKINLENFTIKQKTLKNKFNEDSISLCSFIDEDLNQKKIIELGTGSGIISIFIEKNFKVNEVVSVEIEDIAFDVLKENIKINNCVKIRPYKINIKNLKNFFNPALFDLIITNPPYFKIGHGKKPLNKEKLLARHEVMCDMKDIFNVSSHLLRKLGSLLICYPQTREEEVITNAKRNKFKLMEKKSNNKINFYRLIKDQ
ncbi:MAG: methyltransferase [Thermodesulfobacteriota bacteirum]|jgi:tRNA1Val (adenine37-N6)-methyltransferase|nr:methyltransferase [Thermodesulfobacteriota bacterium]